MLGDHNSLRPKKTKHNIFASDRDIGKYFVNVGVLKMFSDDK